MTAQSRTAGTPQIAPVSPSERYEIIDVIRGFALFGVLLANMILTTQFLALPDEQREALPTAGPDRFSLFLTGTLVDGKFFTLFSMLFGLGFAVQLSRASSRGSSVLPAYTRRLSILFVIGVLHGSLLWFGDVLHIYALLGFVLVLIRDRSDKAVLGLAAMLLLIVMTLPLFSWIAQLRGLDPWRVVGRELPPEEVFQVLLHGRYPDVVRLNWATHLRDYGEVGLGGNILFWYLDILSKFLIGYVVGRRMLLQHAPEHLSRYRRLLPWTLALGLCGSVYMQLGWVYDIARPDSYVLRAVSKGLHEVWIISLAVSYVCLLVLLNQRPLGHRVLRHLAPTGRMALTNYLSQSVFLIVLFYGIGLGLLGEVGASGCLILSVLIFTFQIAASEWWLRRFRFGPAEWVWRCLTYARVQPLRRRDAAASP